MKKCFVVLLLLGIFLFIGVSCKDNANESDFSLETNYPYAYDSPSITADGGLLYFLRTKLTKVDDGGAFSFNPDSSGLWRMDMRTREMELVWVKNLISVEISPDGNSLLYDEGGIIYKADVRNGKIDESSITRLSEISGHFPTWNAASDIAAYVHTVCDEHVCGVWLINIRTKVNSLAVSYGRFPAWLPAENKFLFQKGVIYENTKIIGDSLWIYDIENGKSLFITTLSSITQYFKYDFTGNIVLYTYQSEEGTPQVWSMDRNGNNRKQLTTFGAGRFTAAPDSKIIYLHYNWRVKDINNGTLWIMNMDGSEKEQLTFNDGLTME